MRSDYSNLFIVKDTMKVFGDVKNIRYVDHLHLLIVKAFVEAENIMYVEMLT